MVEAGEQRLEIVLRVNNNLEDRSDFLTLEGGYTNPMNLFTEIKSLKDEEEDITKQVRRLTKNLNTDVNLLKEEIYCGEDDDMTPSVIKDIVDQILELKRRVTGLLNLLDKEPPLTMVFVEGEKHFECSVSEFLSRARRKLLKKKDLKRHQENLQTRLLYFSDQLSFW